MLQGGVGEEKGCVMEDYKQTMWFVGRKRRKAEESCKCSREAASRDEFRGQLDGTFKDENLAQWKMKIGIYSSTQNLGTSLLEHKNKMLSKSCALPAIVILSHATQRSSASHLLSRTNSNNG